MQKFNAWLTDKGERIVGGGSRGAYAGTNQSFGDAEPSVETDDAAAESLRDPFGRDSGDEYGGRTPYRSQKDIQADEDAQRAAQERQAEELRKRAQQQAAFRQASQQRPQAQGGSNVLPFPGMIRGPEGNLYAHVEYIVLLRSRSECTKVIEYIKSNASVFLNMEFIANDSERQRCVDMLSGAAYTLGCNLNKISQRGIYLISSPSVYVVIDPAMQKFTAGGENSFASRGEFEGYAGYGRRPVGQPNGQQYGFAQSAAAGGQTGRFNPQQMAAYAQSTAAGSQTGRFNPQQMATYAQSAAAGGQTGRFNPQQMTAYAQSAAAGNQTASFAAQQTAYAQSASAGNRTTPFMAAQPAPNQRFAAQSGFTASSPTASFAAMPKRSASPFGMQSAFAKGAAQMNEASDEEAEELTAQANS